MLGVPFADFIAPGLIIMGMMQNAFANSSFSLLVGKVQGTIVDYLMPPLSSAELLAGLTAWCRDSRADGRHHDLGRRCCSGRVCTSCQSTSGRWSWFGFLGSSMLALMGVLTSIWAEKFDHAAAIGNFVVAPLALLSGTFYSMDSLAPVFVAISRANPFHYAIAGFRYGFIGEADVSLVWGSAFLLALNITLALLCYRAFVTGWKLKN